MFQPFYDIPESKKDTHIVGSPLEMTKIFKCHNSWVDRMVSKEQELKGVLPCQSLLRVRISLAGTGP